jgi:hypothetical protein
MSEEPVKEQTKVSPVEEAREHMHAARKAMRQTMMAWIPEGYFEHRRAARKEVLLAMRSLVDAAIERVGKEK